jgi:hypothetical protein
MFNVGGEGTWWVSCKSDPRWNQTGRGWGAVTARGPDGMRKHIEECRQKYGEPPPDCEQGFMKD